MMVCIHAAVGAMVGAALKTPQKAFAGGVFSHWVCDLVPHKDYDIKIEAPLALAMFGYLVRRYGVRSPQFWGAVGAVSPDGENALAVLGLLSKDKMLFPSHNETRPWFAHGRKLDSPVSQIFLAAVALRLAEHKS